MCVCYRAAQSNVFRVDGARRAVCDFTVYRSQAEFCDSAGEHCVCGCVPVYRRRFNCVWLPPLHGYAGRSGGGAARQCGDSAV